MPAAAWHVCKPGKNGSDRQAARMGPSSVVEVEIPADRMSRLADGFVGSQIDLLVFDAAPQPLDEHVVPPCSFAIHADRDAVAGERAGEGGAGELRALVGNRYFWPAEQRDLVLGGVFPRVH